MSEDPRPYTPQDRGLCARIPLTGWRLTPDSALLSLCLLASLYYLGAFIWIAGNRMTYPFLLEWLEGVQYLHALRIAHGLPWYPPPSIDFFSDIYPPGLPAAGALVMSLVGERMAALRLVSVAATLASALALTRLVQLYTGRLAHGAVSAGLFLATFEVCGAWFDVARVDMLALACTLWGLALVHRRGGKASFAAGLVLLVAACFVKQNCVAFLAGANLAWLFWSWRRGVLAVLLLPAGILASALPRANPGGYVNNLIFAAAFCSVAAGIALGRPMRMGAWAGLRSVLAYGLVLAQLVWLHHDPGKHLPRQGDLRAGEAVLAKIRQLPPPVLAPYHPYYLHLAGHQPHMHFHLLNELGQSLGERPGEHRLNVARRSLSQRVMQPMMAQLHTRSWGATVSSQRSMGAAKVEENWKGWGGNVTTKLDAYKQSALLLPAKPGTLLYPLTGNKIRPFAAYLNTTSGTRSDGSPHP